MRIFIIGCLLTLCTAVPSHALHNVYLKNGTVVKGRLLLENSTYLVLQEEGRFLLLERRQVERFENPDPGRDDPDPYINGIDAELVFENGIDIRAELLTETGDLVAVRTADLGDDALDRRVYVLPKSSLREISYMLAYDRASRQLILTQGYGSVLTAGGGRRLSPRYGAAVDLPLRFAAGPHEALESVDFSGLAFRLNPGGRAEVAADDDGYRVVLDTGRIFIDAIRKNTPVTVETRLGTFTGRGIRMMVAAQPDSGICLMVHTGPVRVAAASGSAVDVEVDDPRYALVLAGAPGSVMQEQRTATSVELADLAGMISLLDMRTFRYRDAPERGTADMLLSRRGRWWLGVGSFAVLTAAYGIVYKLGNR